MFREAFRKKLTYSVMLDWEGSVVKEFGYTKGVANIYVIDRSGRIVQQVTGAMREAAARAFRPDRPRARKPFARMTASSPLWLITGCCSDLGRALATRALTRAPRDRESTPARATRRSGRAYPETSRSLELDVTKLGAGESCGG